MISDSKSELGVTGEADSQQVSVWSLSPKFRESALHHPWKILRPNELVPLADGMIKLVNTLTIHDVDTLFLMDKSARPIGTLLVPLWEHVSRAPVPDIYFMNIKPFKERGLDGFVVTENEKRIFQETYGDLSGKSICLADAYMDQGKTIKTALHIVEKAWPKIRSVAMTRVLDIFPSWEGKSDPLGVRDRDMTLNSIAHYSPSKKGKPTVFLSKEAPSGKSTLLRSELVEFTELLEEFTISMHVPKDEWFKHTKEIVFAF